MVDNIVKLSDVTDAVAVMQQKHEFFLVWAHPAALHMLQSLLEVEGGHKYPSIDSIAEAITYNKAQLQNVWLKLAKPSKGLITKLFQLYSQYLPDTQIECHVCKGTGIVDTEYKLSWGEAIQKPCPNCSSRVSTGFTADMLPRAY